jgi:transposase
MESQASSVSETARQLGIDRSMLDRWRRERSASANHSANASIVDERDLELRRLQAENRRLREERTVLKKAAAFFANESS